MELLAEVIRILASGEILPEKNKNHALSGEYIGYRECHILPDWLLIYEIANEELILYLTRTGTHSDFFEQYLQRNYWNPKPLGMENNANFFERVIFDVC